MKYAKNMLSLSPVHMNASRPVSEMLDSELVSLAYTSDVPDPDPKQFELAKKAIFARALLIKQEIDPSKENSEDSEGFYLICREIVDSHLESRKSYFGPSQCEPLPDVEELTKDNRDIFIVIKFMDEAPHIKATIQSLLNQKNINHRRIVIVAADNMSKDGSSEIVKELIRENSTEIKMFYIQQETPGGGSTARYGVDRCLATIAEMCETDGDYSRLQRARIAVSDGDTVYHPNLVADSAQTLDRYQEVDGVMPFLLYKITACHRFFKRYVARRPAQLNSFIDNNKEKIVVFPYSLANSEDLRRFPRAARRVLSEAGQPGVMLGVDLNNDSLFVPFVASIDSGLRFGVAEDENGNRAYVFEDRTITLEQAAVSGDETALISLENNVINKDEKWKWHALIGHDLFLTWSFQKMGLSEELILPDTSDALKIFRAWSFAVGGQHQLSRPNMERVTGTDYQSGRVIQSFGGQTVLGSSKAYTETEVDRLAKMIRNFANDQSVFYGHTRSRGLERASGLYLHMTSIQDQVEAEVSDYGDSFYEQIAFPERIIFPFRWMLQNFIGYYARANASDRETVANKSFKVIFDESTWTSIQLLIVTNDELLKLNRLPFEKFRERCEELSEDILIMFWKPMMEFYTRTLTSYFDDHHLEAHLYDWLLTDLTTCRNALSENRPDIDPNEVWASPEFVIDHERGQVLNIKEEMREQ